MSKNNSSPYLFSNKWGIKLGDIIYAAIRVMYESETPELEEATDVLAHELHSTIAPTSESEECLGFIIKAIKDLLERLTDGKLSDKVRRNDAYLFCSKAVEMIPKRMPLEDKCEHFKRFVYIGSGAVTILDEHISDGNMEYAPKIDESIDKITIACDRLYTILTCIKKQKDFSSQEFEIKTCMADIVYEASWLWLVKNKKKKIRPTKKKQPDKDNVVPFVKPNDATVHANLPDTYPATKVVFYKLKIEMMHVTPKIWRSFYVPSNITLDRLHDVIQIIMGWEDSHLHDFVINGKPYTSLPEDEPDGDSEDVYRLKELIKKKGESFDYIYDFGDDWFHKIKLEDINYKPADPSEILGCIAGEGTCPPEDVGGVGGYEEFCEIMANFQHEEHKETYDWYVDMTGNTIFDPSAFDVDEVNWELGKYVKWTRDRVLGWDEV